MLCSWGGGPWVRVSDLNICLQSAAPRPNFLEFFYSRYLRELLFVSVSTPAADVGGGLGSGRIGGLASRQQLSRKINQIIHISNHLNFLPRNL